MPDIKDIFKKIIDADATLSTRLKERVFVVFEPVPAGSNYKAMRDFYPAITMHTVTQARRRCGSGKVTEKVATVFVEARDLINKAALLSRNSSRRDEAASQQEELADTAEKVVELLDNLKGTHHGAIIKSCLLVNEQDVKHAIDPAESKTAEINRRILTFTVSYS